jgi:purine-binding chemotaxis protein CheW
MGRKEVNTPNDEGTGNRQFDWEAAKQRLEDVARVVDEMQELSPERVREVLAERARVLARAPEQRPDSREVVEVIVFHLWQARFAVDTRLVRTVLRSFEVTPVPGGPGFLVGVTNLRGEMLAVIDLGGFFNLKSKPTNEQRSWLLVLGSDRAEFGLLAHQVDEVTMLRLNQIHPAPGSVVGVARDCSRGVTSDALIVLDGEALIAHERLTIDESD